MVVGNGTETLLIGIVLRVEFVEGMWLQGEP